MQAQTASLLFDFHKHSGYPRFFAVLCFTSKDSNSNLNNNDELNWFHVLELKNTNWNIVSVTLDAWLQAAKSYFMLLLYKFFFMNYN